MKLLLKNLKKDLTRIVVCVVIATLRCSLLESDATSCFGNSSVHQEVSAVVTAAWCLPELKLNGLNLHGQLLYWNLRKCFSLASR